MAKTPQQISSLVLDDQGQLVAGLWDVGLWNGPKLGDGAHDLSSVPYGNIDFGGGELFSLMRSFMSIDDFVNYYSAADINSLISHVTGDMYSAQPSYYT